MSVCSGLLGKSIIITIIIIFVTVIIIIIIICHHHASVITYWYHHHYLVHSTHTEPEEQVCTLCPDRPVDITSDV